MMRFLRCLLVSCRAGVMYYRLTLALLQRGFLRMGTRFWLLLGSVAACAWLLMINLSPVFGAVTFGALGRDQAVH